MITLTREGALQTDTLDNLAALDDVPLTGGTDAGDPDYAVDDVADTASNTPTATGDFGVTDPDSGEAEGGARAPTYAIITGTGTDAATVSAASGTAPDLTYTITKNSVTWGTIALNTETGVWTFTADADALNSLDDGESEVLSLQGMVSDAATTAGTDTRTFTITLNGAEDAATVTVADASSDADGDGDAATFDITATAAATATPVATPSPILMIPCRIRFLRRRYAA